MNVANMLSYVAGGRCSPETFELLSREASLRLPGVHEALWSVRTQMPETLRARLVAPAQLRGLLLGDPRAGRDQLVRDAPGIDPVLGELCCEMAEAWHLDLEVAVGARGLEEGVAERRLLREELWEEVLAFSLARGCIQAASVLAGVRPELLLDLPEQEGLDELLGEVWRSRERSGEEYAAEWVVSGVLTRCVETPAGLLSPTRRALIGEILSTPSGRSVCSTEGLVTETVLEVAPELAAQLVTSVLTAAREYPEVAAALLSAEGRVGALVTRALPWHGLGGLVSFEEQGVGGSVVERALGYLACEVESAAATEVLWQVAQDFTGSVAELAGLANAAVVSAEDAAV